jgi:hypothetical protein
MLTAFKWRCADSLGSIVGLLMDAKIHLLPVCELISEVTKVSDHVAKTNAIADDQLTVASMMCCFHLAAREMSCVKS